MNKSKLKIGIPYHKKISRWIQCLMVIDILSACSFNPSVEENFIPFQRKDGKYGIKNFKTGKIVSDCKYGYIENFSEGLASVSMSELSLDYLQKMRAGLVKFGFIDTTGELVIPFEYLNTCPFSEGLAGVWLDDYYGKVGFIDRTGELVIPYQFDWACRCKEGLIAGRINGKYGFTDKTGKEVIPFIYDDVEYFNNGRAEVSLNGEKFYIDKKGERVK